MRGENRLAADWRLVAAWARRDPNSPLVFHRNGIAIRRWRTACRLSGATQRSSWLLRSSATDAACLRRPSVVVVEPAQHREGHDAPAGLYAARPLPLVRDPLPVRLEFLILSLNPGLRHR